MVGRLKFHYWNVVVVLALVLVETFVESQYYLEEESAPRPIYLVDSDVVAAAQPFIPVEGRSLSGSDQGEPGRMFAARMGRAKRSKDDSDEDEVSRH